MAVQAAAELEKGVLVVRLRSQHRKIEAIQKELEKATGSGQRKRLQQMLAETEENARQENEGMVSGFQQHYTFSKYLFLYDTAFSSFNDGVRSGIFLNEKLELDPSLRLNTDNFFLAWFNTDDIGGQSGVEGVRILNAQAEPLPPPFPDFAGRTTMRNLILRIVQGKHPTHAQIVKKLNYRLLKFKKKYAR